MQDIGHPMQAEMIDAAELGSPAVPSPDVGTSKKEPVEDPMECQKDQEDDKKNPMECQKDQGEDTNAPMDCEDSQTSLPEISPTKSDREALELVLHKNVDVDWPVKETFAGRHKNKIKLRVSCGYCAETCSTRMFPRCTGMRRMSVFSTLLQMRTRPQSRSSQPSKGSLGTTECVSQSSVLSDCWNIWGRVL